MRRQESNHPGGVARAARNCWENSKVLVPENTADQAELVGILRSAGVGQQSFPHGGLLGRVEYLDPLTWAHDGAVRLTVASVGQVRPVDIWFWLAEVSRCGQVHAQVRWSLSRDPEMAIDWEPDEMKGNAGPDELAKLAGRASFA